MKRLEKKTRMERRREKMNAINQLKASRSFSFRESKIKDQITFDYHRTVAVWSQTDENSREQITKILRRFGKISRIQDRWEVKENGGRKWFGALVEFAKYDDAKTASLELPLHIK